MSDTPNFFDPKTPLRHAPLNLFDKPLPQLPPDLEARRELTRIAQEQCFATPGVWEFIRSVRYPQQAQCIPGSERQDGVRVTTLEQVKEWYYRVEPDLDKAFGYKPPGEVKTSDWAQRQELWSQQRSQREADKAAREAERERKRAERQEQQVELDAAQAKWKELVSRKKQIMLDIDEQIMEAHEQYKRLRLQFGQL